ncbi:MAG: hypothetical protein DRP08_03635 [Candidatus Aenigmatarchaeota archaeon]|nr:MAG: hypothetical protein DRP08_03635 [Candidatus Aenigmarchaeota archaeon]
MDIDIAINPEMLGNIYEHLINIEEREEQKGAGIYYTPKVEIELMIKRALVEFLYGKTNIQKEKIYYFVFNEDEDIKALLNENEADRILNELEDIRILDPACGSGHYLVVATQILYRLKEKLWEYLKKSHLGKYEEKKKIIERNIYGNDIKYWATEIAKLRLWLELFVDAEIEKLQNYYEPVLPNLKFKIRVGDSLVQRIGVRLVPLRKIKSIVTERREDLRDLINRKQYVYECGSSREYAKTIYLEKKVLQNALSDFEVVLRKGIQNKGVELRGIRADLFKGKYTTEQVAILEKRIKEEMKGMGKELKEIKEFKEALSKLKEPPMIWDLAFAEVFAKKNGFDIVIANPPYVRHEKIEDLTGFYSKAEYKDKLIEQTIKDWSYDYEGKLRYSSGSSTHPIPKNFSKKSDLCVYFYLKGLKLLNENGVLCYISSNSWLDVGFGAKMQEILLKNVPIVAIYDSIKRSFKQADINTIIALMKAPKIGNKRKELKNNVVRFVMFKKPYEEIMDAKTFVDIEKDNDLVLLIEGEKRETDIYKLHVATQKELIEYGKNEEDRYDGNKWGGKYLRAPEIYWKILSKNINRLVPINTFCKYRYGVKPGSVKFFYLTEEKIEKYEIPEKYTYPILTSTQNLNKYYVTIDDCEKLFYCHKSLKKITEKGVYDYIKSGEKEKINKKPSVRNHRPFWYSININTPDIIILQFFDKRHWSPFCKDQITCSNNFCYGQFVINKYVGIVLLNSTLYFLQIEMFGRVNMAQGVLTIYKDDLKFILLPDPRLLDTQKCEETILEISKRNVVPIFEELGLDPSNPIREQKPNPLPDRKALDDIVFDALGLTEEERKEVYWAVAELVKQRLEKARSV